MDVDKTIFLDLINNIAERKPKILRFNAEGIECVNYDGLAFTSNIWLKGGIKSAVAPQLIEKAAREGEDIILQAHTPTNEESKKIIEHITTRNTLELSVSYICVTQTRKTPQPISSWDDLTEKLPKNTISQRTQILKHITEEIHSTTDCQGSLLDVGCGDGALLALLAKKTPELDLWGVDINKKCVLQAKKNLKRKAKILYGNALNLTDFMPKKDFDYASAIGLLDTQVTPTKNTLKILSQIHAILKKEGTLYCTHYTTPTITQKDLNKTGFNILKKTIPENLFTTKEPKELTIAKKTTLI